MYEIILAYLLNHAHVYQKEPEFKERAEIYAKAIDYGTKPIRVLKWGKTNRLKLVALVLTVGEIESYWAKYIHENRCLEGPWKCDVDPLTGLPRARSNWQLWPIACSHWSKIKGADLESTKTAANCAAVKLSGAVSVCGNLKGAFNRYAGKPCKAKWRGSVKRLKKFEKIYYLLTQRGRSF